MTIKDNFFIENWVSQAVPTLLEKSDGKAMSTEDVIYWLMKVYGLEINLQNQVPLFPYADQIKAELGKHGWTLRAGKWSYAKPEKKSKPAA